MYSLSMQNLSIFWMNVYLGLKLLKIVRTHLNSIMIRENSHKIVKKKEKVFRAIEIGLQGIFDDLITYLYIYMHTLH